MSKKTLVDLNKFILCVLNIDSAIPVKREIDMTFFDTSKTKRHGFSLARLFSIKNRPTFSRILQLDKFF